MNQDIATAALPRWFRLSIVALVTLTLCSCQAPLAPVAQEPIENLTVEPQQQASTIVIVDHEQPTSETTNAVISPADAEAPEVANSPAITTEPRIAAACPIGGCETSGCEVGSCPIGSPCGPTCGPASCGPACRPPYTGPGPKDEYLCDGGDCNSPVGVRADWTIDGLEQEDTIAHYDTLDGRVLVEPSNKVCIYAPRFGAVRSVLNASESNQRELINVFEEDLSLAHSNRIDETSTTLQQLPPVIKIGDNPASLLINRQQAGELEARVVIREVKNLIKPYCNLQIVKLGLVDNAEKPWLAKATVAAHTWTGDQAAQVTIDAQAASVLTNVVSPGVMYADCQGDPCLRLVKLASANNAEPGDEVEFTLRFDNVGAQDIGNVTIVDNLTTRLAYVPESAEASVDANFSTKENGAGSLILRWEITKPLKPGEGGVLQFRVKVR